MHPGKRRMVASMPWVPESSLKKLNLSVCSALEVPAVGEARMLQPCRSKPV
jgi:hypothetical protein